MASIAKRLIRCLFAPTKIHLASFLCTKGNIIEICFAMRAVTKRLITALSTLTPVICFTLFYLNYIIPGLSNFKIIASLGQYKKKNDQ